MNQNRRGSMRTTAAAVDGDHKNNNRQATSVRGTLSCTSRSSTSNVNSSNWSFHPEINRNSKWKPKYDDHHDHTKLWQRMHDENRKISSKRRMMSQEKERAEIQQCTFTPKLVSQRQQSMSQTMDNVSGEIFGS